MVDTIMLGVPFAKISTSRLQQKAGVDIRSNATFGLLSQFFTDRRLAVGGVDGGVYGLVLDAGIVTAHHPAKKTFDRIGLYFSRRRNLVDAFCGHVGAAAADPVLL